MYLTEKMKDEIDAMTYAQLLETWRFAPIGDPRFIGESGEYWRTRMNELRAQPGGDEMHVAASKAVGWRGS